MAQSNFVSNVKHTSDNILLQDEVLLNADIIADMASSSKYTSNHTSPSEISLGAGYTVRFEDSRKTLYKSGSKCPQDTLPDQVIEQINAARGNATFTTRIGVSLSDNFGLHMSPDRSFQFYKRITFPDSDENEEQNG